MGANRAIDSNPNPSGTTPGTLPGGSSDLTVDFGYHTPASTLSQISGVVFSDSKNGTTPLDGVQQPGEPGIPGVTITLTTAGPDGQFGTADDVVVGTETTASDGSYSFTNLAAGNYRITEGTPSPVGGVSYIHVASVPGSTGGVVGDPNITTTLPASTSSTGNNFAEFLPFDGHTGAGNIGSNFNGTAIAFHPVGGGSYIWYNSVLKVTGLNAAATSTMLFVSQFITFSYTDPVTHLTVDENLAVPNARLTFSPSVTSATATTTFDTVHNEWDITVPSSGISGNVFLSGLAFKVPANGLPGGINPVTWSGNFIDNVPNTSVNWQWAAAVYTTFSSSYGSLGVKPLDTATGQYNNSDHAGTPENYKSFVTGGARGGGGSNYTGSYSGTGTVTPSDPPIMATPPFSERPLLAGASGGQADGSTADTSTLLVRNAAGAVFAPAGTRARPSAWISAPKRPRSCPRWSPRARYFSWALARRRPPVRRSCQRAPRRRSRPRPWPRPRRARARPRRPWRGLPSRCRKA